MDRQIVCFKVPSFEIALARLDDASLRHRPVAVAPAHTSRACLHEVSMEAREDGLHPGMPVEWARTLCPALRLLPPDPARVRLGDQVLQNIAARFTPVWEPVRPGHMFLDLTGTHGLFGPSVDAAARIEREVLQRGQFTGAMGLGSNKLISRVAADVITPSHLYDVRPGSEEMFLAPLPTSLLPGLSGAYARTARRILDDLNLQTMGAIAEIPLPHLEQVLGPPAESLYRWAHGIDPSPVRPLVQQPRLEEWLPVEPDEVDDRRLLGLVYGLVERLCRRLRQQQRVCRRLMLTIRHSDGVEYSKSHKFDPGTYWEVDMYQHVKELFLRCFQRRVRLRRMTLIAEGLGPPEEQLSLFAPAPDVKQTRANRLSLALDRLRERFGDKTVSWGRVLPLPNVRR